MEPFLARVIHSMERLAPLCLADLSWDNVGLLIHSPPRVHCPTPPSVLLTIDLTSAVIEESIALGASVIVAYHPPIFPSPTRPLKKLAYDDPSAGSLWIRCLCAGISVYSPHSALDATENGINDWIAKGLGPGLAVPIDNALQLTADGPLVGSGRILTLDAATELSTLVNRLKSHFNVPVARLALAPKHTSTSLISKIAICAGAGGSLLPKASNETELYVTGEMSHHQVLAAVQKGISVLLFEHTHTERGYLADVLQGRLSELLSAQVHVSQTDKDPLVFML